MSLTKIHIPVNGRLEPLGWINSDYLVGMRFNEGDVWYWSPPIIPPPHPLAENVEPTDVRHKVGLTIYYVNRAPMVVCVEGSKALVEFEGFASFPGGRKWAK